MKAKIFHSFVLLNWILAVCLLPVTSLPLAAKLLSSSMVAAPSIIFILILIVIWFLPGLLRNKSVNYSAKPVLVFTGYAVFSVMIPLWIDTPVFKDFNIIRNSFEALVTLLIGISFYLITANFFNKTDDIKFFFRLVNLSFFILFAWSFLQFIFWQLFSKYPDWMFTIQEFISISGNLYPGRVTGMAFEPSWLAHQLNMLYIPIFLAATYKKYSAFSRKLFSLTIENIFLFLAVFLLVFSKSRIGWLSFFACLLLVFILLNFNLSNWIKRKFSIRQSIKFIVLPAILIVYIGLFSGAVLLLSKFDPRMENLLNPNTYQNRDLISIANDFSFAERVLYWQTGWKIFNDYPFIGVGLGNSGFFFVDYLPDFAWFFDEPRNLFYQAGYQPNNKNIWTRLLSETGIIGFSIFVVWLIMILIESNYLRKNKEPLLSMIGFAGIFALTAFLFEGFSIDSFALPYYWVMFGIISGANKIASIEENLSVMRLTG